MRFIVLSSVCVLALGCNAASDNAPFSSSDAGAGARRDSGPSSRLDVAPIPVADAGNVNSNCSAAAQLVYVLSTSNKLYSFDPGTRAFTLIGTIRCNPPMGAQPNSMAVDRSATAWVNYVSTDDFGSDNGGWVYKVNTADASCASSPSVTLPDAQWFRLGMGFASDTSGGSSETLYVTGTGTVGLGESPGLGRIDTTTFALSPVGQFTGDRDLTGQSAELTGTGDARLFGFFTTTPVRVAQLQKTNGAVLSDMPVNGVPTPSAWAFSFWGGAFYLYTSDGTTNSTVTKFNPTTMEVDSSYTLQAPDVIDGAGVLTCAPLTAPQ